MSASLPPVGNYRIPPLGNRILVGGLRLIPTVLLLVGIPAGILTYLGSHGLNLPLSVLTVTIAGLVIAALSTARYVLKPTRLYGPLSIATSAVALVYLLAILAVAQVTLHLSHPAISIGVDYSKIIELVLLVPALGLAAGVVTTIEDVRSPRERLPFDYPP